MEPDVDILDQDIETQNTNTDDLDGGLDDNLDNDNFNDNSDDQGKESQEVTPEDEEKALQEQLDAITSMDDDAFFEYMNSGKLPGTEKVEPKEKEVTTDEDKDPVDDKTKQTTVKDADQLDIDETELKAVHAAIFKPFKANGKEITPKSVDDVISLMQMGANYTKKMQLMAPMKKAVESLNKAQINEEDLNFLIDVHNGDKEAIKKLLAKHEVDPIELDMENTNYVPKNNIASDDDVEYSDVLEDIQPSLPKIQEILTKQWDAKSKSELLKNPQLMRALHEEIEMGRFDDVQAQLEIEKTFGRYKGKSDIEAYIDLVSRLVAEQQSKATVETRKPTQDNKPTKPVPDKTKAAPVRTKQTNHVSTLTAEDILSMPEEEFNKLTMRDLV